MVPSIEQVTVFSPQEAGFTTGFVTNLRSNVRSLDAVLRKKYDSAVEELRDQLHSTATVVTKLAHSWALADRVIDMNRKDYGTLREFLYAPAGYFAQNPNVQSVMFIDGQFSTAKCESDIFSVAEMDDAYAKADGIPLTFPREYKG